MKLRMKAMTSKAENGDSILDKAEWTDGFDTINLSLVTSDVKIPASDEDGNKYSLPFHKVHVIYETSFNGKLLFMFPPNRQSEEGARRLFEELKFFAMEPFGFALQIAPDQQDMDIVREKALEEAASLCERTRCREWSPKECATQIRKQLTTETEDK